MHNSPEVNPPEENSALTGIRDMYTLSNTGVTPKEEVEAVMVEDFLQTLAEVALAVAARKANIQSQGKCGSCGR